MRLRALAPAKVNLCLFLGGVREDGRHELVTLFESVSLADELTLEVRDSGDSDEVHCPGVPGLNLVSRALAALRAGGWSAPPVAIEIDKRIPVAAGLGGGSADAAAALRLAGAVAPTPGTLVGEVAAGLGADVPGQVMPGVSLGRGAGELIEPLAPLAPHAYLILPLPFPLATAQVYRRADGLGLARGEAELAGLERHLRDVLGRERALPGVLLVNDLQAAALELRAPIEQALDDARYAGAEHAMVSGSGPTVLGLFWGEDAAGRATAGAAALAGRYPGATVAVPVDASFGAPQPA
jgi:4-diphosphocytidyl-2-C-methyl-D-erythritol kinase